MVEDTCASCIATPEGILANWKLRVGFREILEETPTTGVSLSILKRFR
jgi:hypothetical protein